MTTQYNDKHKKTKLTSYSTVQADTADPPFERGDVKDISISVPESTVSEAVTGASGTDREPYTLNWVYRPTVAAKNIGILYYGK